VTEQKPASAGFELPGSAVFLMQRYFAAGSFLNGWAISLFFKD